MTKSVRVGGACVAARAWRFVAFVSACAVFGFAAQARPQQQTRRVEIALRSFAPTASGRLTVEASDRGGRARLTALGMPDPQTLSRAARTYVVWASGGGRFVRLGELQRDERGNGGLAFNHPQEFERYTLLVTAETSAEPERPAGAPVLSTRAGEAQPVYAPTNAGRGAPSSGGNGSNNTRTRTSTVTTPTGADFYTEVDAALDTHGGGRPLLLEGERVAPRAKGQARVTAYAGNGYVRVRFRGVPVPSSVGANLFVMWAVVPDGRIVYMGSLPATRVINFADIYVRVAGFDADDFELFVTAEMRRPLFTPSDRRALSTRRIRSNVK